MMLGNVGNKGGVVCIHSPAPPSEGEQPPEFLGRNKVFLALIYLPQTPCFACQGTLIYSPPQDPPVDMAARGIWDYSHPWPAESCPSPQPPNLFDALITDNRRDSLRRAAARAEM